MQNTQIVIRFDNYPARRCNKTCWNSTSNHCHCACGGVNHGIGAKAAQEKTVEQLTQAIQAKHPHNPLTITLLSGQLSLF